MKLTKRQIRSYGIGGYATMFGFTMFTANGMYFFTDVVKLAPIMASIIITIGTVWDAITDVWIANWIDKREDPKGKYRPVILAAAIPFGVVCWLMFTDVGLSKTCTVVYFSVLTMLFYTFQTLVDVPYSAISSHKLCHYAEENGYHIVGNLLQVIQIDDTITNNQSDISFEFQAPIHFN